MTDLSLNARPIRRADIQRGNRARPGSLAEGLRRRGLAEGAGRDEVRPVPGPAREKRPSDPPTGAVFPDAPVGVGSPVAPAGGPGPSRLAARLNAEGPIRGPRQARDRAAARAERNETPERERPGHRVPDRPAGRPGPSGSAAVPPSIGPADGGAGPVRSGPAHFRRRSGDDTTSAHRLAPAHLAGRSGDDEAGDPTVSPLISMGATAVATAAVIAPVNEPDESNSRHLEVVPPRRRSVVDQRKRTRLLLGLSAVAAAVVVFSLVYLHVISTEEQFRIDKLAAEETQQEQTYQDLRLQANRAASPSFIYNQATKKLGMTEPTSVRAVPAPRGSATPASSDLTPSNGATAPAGVSDWPGVESETGGGS